jgi:hypothetical protein
VIAHLVLFRPRPGLTASDEQAFSAAFLTAVREIPTVRGIRLGRRVRHGAGYEAASPDAADFLAVIDFDDLDGLQAYLRHPAHEELGTRFGESIGPALIYDFEVGGVEILLRRDSWSAVRPGS